MFAAQAISPAIPVPLGDDDQPFWKKAKNKADGYLPAVIADFQRNRYALPPLGPELVTNPGPFTATTGWTGSNATLSVESARLRVTNSAAANGYAYQLLSLVAGKTYAVIVNYTAGTSASATLRGSSTQSGSGQDQIASVTLSAGANTVYFTATVSGVYIILRLGSSTSGEYSDFGSVSVREVQLGEFGANLVVDANWSMSVGGGTSTATNSPSGTLNLTGDGTFNAIGDQSFTTVVGQAYTLMSSIATNNVTIRVGTAQGGFQNVVDVIGTAGTVSTVSFIATGTTTWVRFYKSAANTSVVSSITLRTFTPSNKLRSATFDEVFAFTAASTTTRTYTGPDQVIYNNLAANQPRFTRVNGVRQLALNNAATNKCTNYNAAPPALVTPAAAATFNAAVTNMTASGDAAALFGVVADATVLAAAGLGTITNGRVYKIDNSAGVANARVTVAGATGNLNVHSITAYVVGGTGYLGYSTGTTSGKTAFASSSSYVRRSHIGSPDDITRAFQIYVDAGQVVYFTLNQLEESSFASPVIPVAGAAATRQIETARFSPLVEAILQRSAAGVVVRGSLAATPATVWRIVGGISNSYFAGANASNTVGRISSTSSGLAVTAGSGGFSTGFGFSSTFDSSGRGGAINGGTVASDANGTELRTTVYLGRDATAAAGTYGDGTYDEVVIYPFRPSSGALQAQARVYQ